MGKATADVGGRKWGWGKGGESVGLLGEEAIYKAVVNGGVAVGRSGRRLACNVYGRMRVGAWTSGRKAVGYMRCLQVVTGYWQMTALRGGMME